MGLKLWITLLVIRIINALLLNTYFDPDEQWQTIEIAHQYVFGYGWQTWEWNIGLRSYLYLLPFISYFQVLKFFNAHDVDALIIYGPKVLQAISAATVDYLTYIVSLRSFQSRKAAEATVLLVLLATLYWPIEPNTRFPIYKLLSGLFFVGLSILNRPSAITHWIVPIVTMMIVIPGISGKLRFFTIGIAVAGFVILLGVGIDSLFYGKLAITWWSFFKVNVIERISDFYGMNAWHYHISQSLPAMMGTMLPLVFLTIICDQYSTWMLQFLIGSLTFNSLLPHKEIRFVYPLMPFLMILAGQGYRVLSAAGTRKLRWLKRIYLLTILVTNVVAGVYFMRYHQSGIVQVMDFIRDKYDDGEVKSVFFAMPCHSTPYYGYLHRRIAMSFITCEPPLEGQDIKRYKNENDKFYDDPASFLHIHLPNNVSHLVLFDNLLEKPKVMDFMTSAGLKECFRIFNSHVNPDERRKGDVLVLCR